MAIYDLTTNNTDLNLSSGAANIVFIRADQDLVTVNGPDLAPQIIYDMGKTTAIEANAVNHVTIEDFQNDPNGLAFVYVPVGAELPKAVSDGAGGTKVGNVDFVNDPLSKIAGHLFIENRMPVTSGGG